MGQISERNPLQILFGKVIHGRGIGKRIGMPTANIEVSDESLLPPAGVYITEIMLDERVYYGITNIGTRRLLTMTRKYPLRHIFWISVGKSMGKA